jgi:lipopolysaccharide export system protein LptA
LKNYFLYIIPLFFSVFNSFSQENKSERFELLQADELIGDTYRGQSVRKLIGNVIFKKNDGFMYCDSAYQYVNKSDIDAFGHVKMTQGDSVTIWGDSLFYNSQSKMARLRGNITMVDRKMKLVTRFLDYDLNDKSGHFFNGGTVTDPKNVLVSEEGFYYSKTEHIVFKRKVVLVNPEYTINSDDLEYNTKSKISYLKGPSTVKGKDGDIYTEYGMYNTETEIADFTKNAKLTNKDVIIEGQKLYFEEKTGYGLAKEKVKITSLKDSFLILGNEAKYWQKIGISKVYQNPVFISISNGDSLFLKADTLLSVEIKDKEDDSKKDSLKKDADRNIFAYHNCKIYKKDFQASCDSLAYLFSDSAIHFFKKPVLWSEQSQITADTIIAQLANSEIDKLYMRTNSFIITEDSLKNYNQVKGLNMIANFVKKELSKVYVYDQGQSIYWALEEDTAIIGLNIIDCKDMIISLDSSKLKRVNFIAKPKAKFVPPHEIIDSEAFLKGFAWRKEERPERKDVE